MAVARPHLLPLDIGLWHCKSGSREIGSVSSLAFRTRRDRSPGDLPRPAGGRLRRRSTRSDGGSTFSPATTSGSSPRPFIMEKPEGAQGVDLAGEGVDEEELDRRMKQQHQPREGIAARWRELAGGDDWAGLLDPIDPLLRAELIRYGELAQACYDAYDFDPFSRNCGSCKYTRRRFFESLGMAAAGYDVTRYLYATSNVNFPNFSKRSRWPKVWSEVANWIGYVAVSDDATTARLGRRDIVVAWRGTVTRLEWVADLTDFLKPVTAEGIRGEDAGVKVESGFLNLYTDKDPAACRFAKYSAREQVLTELRRLMQQYAAERREDVSITVTGHSLGSALAVLSAYDMAATGVNGAAAAPICVFSFSGPRVGNGRFKERFEGELGVKALRVVNVHDTVPKVPGVFINERVPAAMRRVGESLPWSYHHVGVELALDHRRSPFLKETTDPACFHNLEAHLHLLDGYHDKKRRFVLASGRDPALVNKSADFLKDHHMVPPNWRQDENRGMIRNHDGRWMQPDRPRTDEHPPDIHHHLRELGLRFDH